MGRKKQGNHQKKVNEVLFSGGHSLRFGFQLSTAQREVRKARAPINQNNRGNLMKKSRLKQIEHKLTGCAVMLKTEQQQLVRR